jgi:hypothetical protein
MWPHKLVTILVSFLHIIFSPIAYQWATSRPSRISSPLVSPHLELEMLKLLRSYCSHNKLHRHWLYKIRNISGLDSNKASKANALRQLRPIKLNKVWNYLNLTLQCQRPPIFLMYTLYHQETLPIKCNTIHSLLQCETLSLTIALLFLVAAVLLLP